MNITAQATRDVGAVFGMEGQMHLAVSKQPPAAVSEALQHAKDSGIGNIFALRGNLPETPIETNLKNAVVSPAFSVLLLNVDPVIGSCCLSYNSQFSWLFFFPEMKDLVKLIRQEHGDHFGIGVGGYVEGHHGVIRKCPDSYKFSEAELRRRVKVDGSWYVTPDAEYEQELQYLKAKVDAGADFVVTQAMYDVELFEYFVKRAREVGIEVPIIPGMSSVGSLGFIQGQVSNLKAHLPQNLQEAMVKHADNEEAFLEVAAEHLGQQIKDLVSLDHRFVHICTINNAKATFDALKHAGLDVQEASFTPEEQASYDAALANIVSLV